LKEFCYFSLLLDCISSSTPLVEFPCYLICSVNNNYPCLLDCMSSLTPSVEFLCYLVQSINKSINSIDCLKCMDYFDYRYCFLHSFASRIQLVFFIDSRWLFYSKDWKNSFLFDSPNTKKLTVFWVWNLESILSNDSRSICLFLIIAIYFWSQKTSFHSTYPIPPPINYNNLRPIYTKAY
jgi:hypothetical protein